MTTLTADETRRLSQYTCSDEWYTVYEIARRSDISEERLREVLPAIGVTDGTRWLVAPWRVDGWDNLTEPEWLSKGENNGTDRKGILDQSNAAAALRRHPQAARPLDDERDGLHDAPRAPLSGRPAGAEEGAREDRNAGRGMGEATRIMAAGCCVKGENMDQNNIRAHLLEIAKVLNEALGLVGTTEEVVTLTDKGIAATDPAPRVGKRKPKPVKEPRAKTPPVDAESVDMVRATLADSPCLTAAKIAELTGLRIPTVSAACRALGCTTTGKTRGMRYSLPGVSASDGYSCEPGDECDDPECGCQGQED